MLASAVVAAPEPAPPNTLPEVSLQKLSERQVTPLGEAALSIRAADWKHAETANFIYHFFSNFVAAPVAAEAEFHYRLTARDLVKDTAQWERKCHVFIFETDAEWAQFQKKGALDPWTGGIHAGGDLFIQRNPQLRWKGSTLAHEVAHLVVHRFFGPGVPLWLDEGYAEYAGTRGHTAFFRARGYAARPRAEAVDPAHFISLAKLTAARAYPTAAEEVAAFYNESERLVRFLSATDKAGFGTFFEALSKGNRLESALSKGFGTRFKDLAALEREFRIYATKEYGTAVGD